MGWVPWDREISDSAATSRRILPPPLRRVGPSSRRVVAESARPPPPRRRVGPSSRPRDAESAQPPARTADWAEVTPTSRRPLAGHPDGMKIARWWFVTPVGLARQRRAACRTGAAAGVVDGPGRPGARNERRGWFREGRCAPSSTQGLPPPSSRGGGSTSSGSCTAIFISLTSQAPGGHADSRPVRWEVAPTRGRSGGRSRRLAAGSVGGCADWRPVGLEVAPTRGRSGGRSRRLAADPVGGCADSRPIRWKVTPASQMSWRFTMWGEDRAVVARRSGEAARHPAA
jgi:hypothetical protein